MKDRILKIITDKNLTSSRFADEVGLNRPAVSHILNGRNNPGLDAIQRILSRYPDINPGWLISGSGPMYIASDDSIMPSLFDEREEFPPLTPEETEYPREIAPKTPQNTTKLPVVQDVKLKNQASVKVRKIAIFYSDNTYEEFVPSER